ncbi:hypothetical protein [Pseudonocardia spinosispora]|uniref:hypothetical protein n=1 Tax=Pseudonocardia spinosispora TaxID=103441 RepID=UPI00048B2AC2|nr:hypothetical protein [Pseudonocardia spinosispora]
MPDRFVQLGEPVQVTQVAVELGYSRPASGRDLRLTFHQLGLRSRGFVAEAGELQLGGDDGLLELGIGQPAVGTLLPLST